MCLKVLYETKRVERAEMKDICKEVTDQGLKGAIQKYYIILKPEIMISRCQLELGAVRKRGVF